MKQIGDLGFHTFYREDGVRSLSVDMFGTSVESNLTYNEVVRLTRYLLKWMKQNPPIERKK